MKYEDRIVCFIDILGFKTIINGTVDREDNDIESEIKLIHEILSLGLELLDIEDKYKLAKSKIVTQFSDSFVISFLVNERSEIFSTLIEILHLIMNFMVKGILVRGGIAYGKLIHTNKVVFGPGLLMAYETESRAALYPRVILDETVINIAKMFHSYGGSPNHEEDSIMNVITKDTDDMYYIDYIQKVQSELDDPEIDMVGYIEKLKNIIEPLKDNEAPDIKVKIGWLKNKVNKLIDSATNEKYIKALKKSGNFELAEYYSGLKTI
ncbi:MAG TPA: hypothetical protein PKH16_12740 [Aequorivita sp.]|nr:hypothetical protein [Aequorivita sp.]